MMINYHLVDKVPITLQSISVS